MNILYRITYLPHLKNQTPPYYYVGSKYNYDKKYFGSPSSKQKDWYSGELDICNWWKQEIKDNKDNFYFEIMSEYDKISPKQLVEEEKKIHIELNVKNSKEYFNKSVATTGWVSIPRTDETKKKISKITKKYWEQNSQKALERRAELSERNKKTKSKELKEKWKNPSDKMLDNYERFVNMAKTQKTEEWKQKMSDIVKKNWDLGRQRTIQKVFCCGVIYENAVEASKVVGITPTNIRRRCRLEQYSDWYYLK